MANKQIHVDGIGPVQAYKRRGTRSIRLRITPSGQIRVTIPYWLPYRSAHDFVRKKRDWISSRIPIASPIHHGDTIGRSHVVRIEYVPKTSASTVRVSNEVIHVKIPFGADHKSTDIQKKLVAGCERALRKEAEAYLPKRLAELARQQRFSYNQVSVKKMQSRWGSCSQQKNISLNVYLMQLDDSLIDYVILHELTHTKVLSHSKAFWNELANHTQDLHGLRKRIKQEEPVIRSSLYSQKY